MARYKKTTTITLRKSTNPESVKAVNRVAKEQNRSVHDVADQLLLEACKNVPKPNTLCQGVNNV